MLSEDRDGRRYEIFEIVSGASSAVKGGRAAFHYTADLITLGLWEVVTVPTNLVRGDALFNKLKLWWPRVELNHRYKDFQTARVELDL